MSCVTLVLHHDELSYSSEGISRRLLLRSSILIFAHERNDRSSFLHRLCVALNRRSLCLFNN